MNEPTNHDPSLATDASTTPASSVGSARNAKRAMQATTEYVSRLLAASLLTMWGAINVIANAQEYRTLTEDVTANDAWWISGLLFLLTCVLPLLIGLILFRKLMR